MKKKLRDCTYGELKRYCIKNGKNGCAVCPLFRMRRPYSLCERRPDDLDDDDLDIEIDIP